MPASFSSDSGESAAPLPASAAVDLREANGLRCLVIGAGGFLGRALTDALCDAGASVEGYGKALQAQPRAGVIWTEAALEDGEALAKALVGKDIVFHLASSSLPQASNSDPVGDVRDNVIPTLHLLNQCLKEKVRKVVFASSGGTVYGVPKIIPTPEHADTAPISAYGIHKRMIEHYLELYRYQFGLDYHVLRIANPYGCGQIPFRTQGVVAVMLYKALTGQPIELWGTGDVVRDYIYIDDVASAFITVGLYNGNHRVMNLGSGHGRSLNDVVTDITRVAGHPEVSVLRLQGRPVDVPVSVLDTTLIQQETGWRPATDWQQGLLRTANWLRATYRL